jgi:hypothetical protein
VTEAEWLANTSSKRMMRFLARPLADRKAILFDAACCRRLGDLLTDRRSREALAVLERFADGGATKEQLRKESAAAAAAAAKVDAPRQAMDRLVAQQAPEADSPAFRQEHRRASRLHWAAYAVVDAFECVKHLRRTPSYLLGSTHVLMRCQNALSGDGPLVGPGSNEDAFGVDAPRLAESKHQADLVRDVFGNPFRHVVFKPAWRRVPAAPELARSAYEQHLASEGRLDNARLAVLSDALEEAGCTDEAILTHLRSTGPHVRGCWALDLVLGRP